MSRTIFLSTVTNEFLVVRRRLAALGTRTKRLHVRHEDDFVQRGVLTLHMLEQEIEKSHLVIHVIGDRPGAVPPLVQVEDVLVRHPDFANRFPDVVAAARKGEVSYTQWEAWLTLYLSGQGKPLRLCCYELVGSRQERDVAQDSHVGRLKQCEVYPTKTTSKNDLVDEVVLTLIELGYLTPEEGRHVIHLPYPSLGSLFKGREETLRQLRESLTRSGRSATAITGKAVHGMGGVGKTRLAVEYAWAHADDYSAVLCITADSPSGLKRNLAELVGPKFLNLPEQGATEEEVHEGAVVRWLQDHHGWFLILDNVDTEDAAEQVEKLLADLPGGHVLITSRLSNWGEHVEPLPLDVLPEEPATRFLLERTAPRTDGRGRLKRDTDEADARLLARELDGLALALEQAGAYVAHQRISLAEYHQLWKSHEPAVLHWHREREMKYPRRMAITWQTTLDQLGPHEVDLMNLLAWLSPDPVPLGWFESPRASELSAEGIALFARSRTEATPATTPVPGRSTLRVVLTALANFCMFRWNPATTPVPGRPTVRDAVAALADFSMLRWDTSSATVTVHRVMQEILRTRQTEPIAWLSGALQLLVDAHPGTPDDVRTWRDWEPLRSHVAFATAEGERLNITSPTTILMGELAGFLKAKALFTAGEQLERRALTIDERAYGPDSPQAALRLSNLAQTLQVTNRLAEAEPLMRRAVSVLENAFGENNPVVAVAVCNLGLLLKDTNRLAEAEPLMRRALAIDEQSYGAEHPEVAIRLSNLAQLLQATNCLTEAELLMRRVVTILENPGGESLPNYSGALNNLAHLLQATNRLAEAEPLMRHALAIDEPSYGAEHPKVAIRLNNLAQLLQATNRLAEAEPLMRSALAIDEQCYGAEHPRVAIGLNNLAHLLQDTNRLVEAEPLMRRALAIDEQSYGAEHPSVAFSLNNLSSLLLVTNRLAEAEPLMRRALDIFRSSLGDEHPNTLIISRNYANLRVAMTPGDPRKKLRRRHRRG